MTINPRQFIPENKILPALLTAIGITAFSGAVLIIANGPTSSAVLLTLCSGFSFLLLCAAQLDVKTSVIKETDRQVLVKETLKMTSGMAYTKTPQALQNEIIHHILKDTSKTIGVERVGFWRLKDNDKVLFCEFCYVSSEDSFESGAALDAKDYPTYFAHLTDDTVIDAHDARMDERTSEFRDGYLDPQGITSMLDTKVFMNNRTSGIICIEHVGPRRQWTPLEIELASSAANLLSVASDALEARVLSDQLAKEKEKADASNRAKSVFLANMSHEIRTPLNGVIGMANVLKSDQTMGEKQSDRLDVIVDSGEVLLELLNNILDLSKIEAGQMELESTPFELDELLQKAQVIWTHAANSKNLTYKADLSGLTYPELLGDPTRLRQVLVNLVGNAIKFTDEGEVILNVTQSIENGIYVRTNFAIQDTGIGIADEDRETLFADFKQADPSTTRRFGGTGLGLSISRRLARAMGGDIEIVSTSGEGSSFLVSVVMLLTCDETDRDVSRLAG